MRHVRLCVALIVATLLVVPPLVRATQHFDNGSASSLLRLNRGFAAPETKSQVLPPSHNAVVQALAVDEPPVPPIARRVHAFDECLPDSPPDSPPDALRGPPLSTFV